MFSINRKWRMERAMTLTSRMSVKSRMLLGVFIINLIFFFHISRAYGNWNVGVGRLPLANAITAGIVRHCVTDLHSGPVASYAESEVHGSNLNDMEATFQDVRYKAPEDNVWRLFDSQVVWLRDSFPYAVADYSPSYFDTYRLTTDDWHIPLIVVP